MVVFQKKSIKQNLFLSQTVVKTKMDQPPRPSGGFWARMTGDEQAVIQWILTSPNARNMISMDLQNYLANTQNYPEWWNNIPHIIMNPAVPASLVVGLWRTVRIPVVPPDEDDDDNEQPPANIPGVDGQEQPPIGGAGTRRLCTRRRTQMGVEETKGSGFRFLNHAHKIYYRRFF
jgi:hypothetical protein